MIERNEPDHRQKGLMAGAVGFEPTNAGIKIQSLTT